VIGSKNLVVSHYVVFSQSPHTFFLLCPNILLITLFSNTLSPCSSRNIKDQVSHPYKTTGTIKNLNKQIVNKMTALSKFGRNRSVDMTLKFDSLQAQGFVIHNKAEAANYEPHLKFCFFLFPLRRVTQRSLENWKIKIKNGTKLQLPARYAMFCGLNLSCSSPPLSLVFSVSPLLLFLSRFLIVSIST